MDIRTVRVFVSSTWEDLRPERAAAKEAVLRARPTSPAACELKELTAQIEPAPT